MNLYQYFKEEAFESTTVKEMIEDGFTEVEIDKYIEQGYIELSRNGIVKFLDSGSAMYSMSMYTFKVTEYDGDARIFHGLRIDNVNGSFFYLQDPEYFNELKSKALFELVGYVSVQNSSQIISALDMKEYDPEVNVYRLDRVYGGSEEGGWYWTRKSLTGIDPEGVIDGVCEFGTGYEVRKEFFSGQNATPANYKPIYC